MMKVKRVLKTEEDSDMQCSFCGRGEAEGLFSVTKSIYSEAGICLECAMKVSTLMMRTETMMKQVVAQWEAEGCPEPTGKDDCPCPSCKMRRASGMMAEEIEAEDVSGLTMQ